MLIDNSTAISHMMKDIAYFYYDIVNLRYMSKNIAVFANTIDDLKNHKFITVVAYDDKIFISLYTNDISVISEAILFAKEKYVLPIYLSVANDIDISFLNSIFSLKLSDNQENDKHWGIFGVIENTLKSNKNNDIIISVPSAEDISLISALPNKEWAFLPQRIKSIKNILIAKKEDDFLGYIIYDSIHPGHRDILMLYVHPNYRRFGVATKLLQNFAEVCRKQNAIPYYVCANSESSAKLAISLNIEKLRNETVIYELTNSQTNLFCKKQ